MKRLTLLFVSIFIMASLWSQDMNNGSSAALKDDRNFRIPLIGEKAPSFYAESTNGAINFPDDFGISWKILFAHPQDFTPVCSSELLELSYLQNQFEKLGVKLLVISTDPLETHEQWKKALEQLDYKGRDKARIRFPLVDDNKLEVSKKYGMIHSATNSTRYVRGVFIIDPENIVRAVYFYPMEVGRSTAELLRTVTALKTVDNKAVMTPADWTPGDDVVVPYLPTTKAESSNDVPEGYYRLAWFLNYKKASN
ncbi:MAG: redoxin domain-containing protein [Bacteroidales bacterium]|jgi:peroxiredoxin (alkyl hydroperoxide reductase subunit C)|nr:redoxin domain-containing protein [Bacteroidales bacterium]